MITGVSSLPALSSRWSIAIYRSSRDSTAIRIGISSGALVPGIATVRAVFSYCGKPIRVFERRAVDRGARLARSAHARISAARGQRLFGRCDVPDLDAAAARAIPA